MPAPDCSATDPAPSPAQNALAVVEIASWTGAAEA